MTQSRHIPRGFRSRVKLFTDRSTGFSSRLLKSSTAPHAVMGDVRNKPSVLALMLASHQPALVQF